MDLFVDVPQDSGLVVDDLVVREPKGDLLLRRLDAVRAVDDVATDVNAVVTTNASGFGRQRVGGADDLAAGLHDVLALPDHGHDGSRGQEVRQTTVERLRRQILVVTLGVGLRRLHELHGHEEIATTLKALDDRGDETALNAIGLDLLPRIRKNSCRLMISNIYHNVGAFIRHLVVGLLRMG